MYIFYADICVRAEEKLYKRKNSLNGKCIAIYIMYVGNSYMVMYYIAYVMYVYKSPRKLNRSTPSKRCCLKRTDAQTDGWKLVQYVRNRNAAVFFFFFFFYVFRKTKMCVKPMNMMMIIT